MSKMYLLTIGYIYGGIFTTVLDNIPFKFDNHLIFKDLNDDYIEIPYSNISWYSIAHMKEVVI